ncbi:MAG: PepSY domain-containing protein [Gordonia sp. (in: high G+C Gram-positive bacteria)]
MALARPQSTLSDTSPPDSRPAVDPPLSATTTRLVRRLHFYAGVFVAPFLLIAAISGGLYALAPQAEKIIYRAQLHTDSTGPQHSLAEQIQAAARTHPDLAVSAVRPPASAGDTTQVLFTDPSLPESTRLAVFVDPVTLHVQGELPTFGSSGSLPVGTWIDGLHRNLHLGATGRLYSELAASWLWVIALAGLVLWALDRRKKRPRRNLRERVKRRHGLTGVTVLLVLLFLSATGLTWSQYAGKNVSDLRTALHWTQPSVDTSLGGAPAPTDPHAAHGSDQSMPGMDMSDDAAPAADPADVDTALALARSAGVGVDDAVEIGIPSTPDTAFTVSERRVPWQVSPNTAAVDPVHDRVVSVNYFADWPLAAKLANWGIAAHMGLLFGLVNQLVLFAVAVALCAMIVSGYRMWWLRRRRGAPRPGRAPTRGSLRRLPWPAIVGLIIATVAIGWFVPLFGLSLLAFFAVDLLLSGWARLRRRTAAQAEKAAA